jgi:hypothetical protein
MLGNLFGGNDEPKREVVNLDQATSRMMEGKIADANVGAGELARRDNAGLDNIARNTMAQPTMAPATEYGMNEAISRKYQNLAQDQIGKIKLNSELQSQMKRSNRQRNAAALVLGVERNKQQAQAQLFEAQQAMQSARNSVLSSLLGIGGMAAGMYASGQFSKPQGPSMTSSMQMPQVGSSVGEMQTPTEMKYNLGMKY